MDPIRRILTFSHRSSTCILNKTETATDYKYKCALKKLAKWSIFNGFANLSVPKIIRKTECIEVHVKLIFAYGRRLKWVCIYIQNTLPFLKKKKRGQFYGNCLFLLLIPPFAKGIIYKNRLLIIGKSKKIRSQKQEKYVFDRLEKKHVQKTGCISPKRTENVS